MKKCWILMGLLAFLPSSCAAQTPSQPVVQSGKLPMWENLNPGGGGQIQDIVLDPNVPGRAYWCSDMEGAYRTDDHGQSWTYIGANLTASNTLTITPEPGNSERLYAGLKLGLNISDDGGKTWRNVREVENEPIMAIAVNPRNRNEVVAGVSNRWRWQPGGRERQRVIGQRGVYWSKDRGATWQYMVFEPTEGRRDTFTLSFTPDGKTLFVGARAGLYQTSDSGASWKKIAAPIEGECWGAALSPDGKTLVATFSGTDDNSRLYTKSLEEKTPDAPWKDIFTQANFTPPAQPGANARRGVTFWLPRIDPRSTAEELRVLVAPFSSRTGLFEATIRLNNATIRSIFDYKRPMSGGFDSGWEEHLPRPLAYEYSPKSWPKRDIWTTGDQTLFRTETEKPGFERNWQSLYTQFVREENGTRFYRTRGAQSTFIFDADSFKNYVVQSNADNGIVESYDGGQSWTVGIKQPRSNAVVVMRDLNPPIVLAHTSRGYGPAAQNGTLWAKTMETSSARDRWRSVGGGQQQAAGLPNVLYNQIVADPHNPKRAFIGTQGQGIFVLDDVPLLLAGRGAARNITQGSPLQTATINDKGGALIPDPLRADVLWVAAGRAIWRGEAQGENWTWRQLRDVRGSAQLHIAVWAHENKTLLACESGGRPNGMVEISRDEGATWNTLVNFEDVKPLRRVGWYEEKPEPLQVAGLIGWRDRVFFAYANWWENGRGYGVFEAKLGADGKVALRDVTGNLHYPWPVKTRIAEVDGSAHLLFATRGSGLWRWKM